MKLIDLAIPQKLFATVPVVELSLEHGQCRSVVSNLRLKELLGGNSTTQLEIGIEDLAELIIEAEVLGRFASQSSLAKRFRLRADDGPWVPVRAEFIVHREGEGRVLLAGVVIDERPMRRMDQLLARSASVNQLLLDVADLLSRQNMEVSTTLEGVARIVSVHFNAICDISMANLNTGNIYPMATYHADREVVNEVKKLYAKRQLHIGEGMVGRVIQNGETYLNNEAIKLVTPHSEVDPIILPRAIFYVPLKGRNGTLGALSLTRIVADLPITETEQSVMRDVSNLVSIFIDANEANRKLQDELIARKETEDLIRIAEARQRTILQNVEDVIVTLDADGVILFYNHAMGGFDDRGFIGTKLLDYSDEASRPERKALMENALREMKPTSWQRVAHDSGGKVRWFNTGVYPIGVDGEKERFIVIARDLTAQYESELKVLNAMVNAQEAERANLAAELHDGIGQVLTSIGLELTQVIGSNANDQRQQLERLTNLHDRVGKAVYEVRNISHGLRPQVLEAFGLVAAIRELCREMNQLSGINVMFDTADVPDHLPKAIESNFFRISQELVNNAHKHSSAKNVNVNLTADENDLTLTVEDDGVGIASTNIERGIGLKNVETRTRVMSGTLEVESSEGRGVFVSVTVPLQYTPMEP